MYIRIGDKELFKKMQQRIYNDKFMYMKIQALLKVIIEMHLS